ncbi:MAG: GDP-mannose 4,6-dehydratase [Trueperaceae bacterium]|nr:GDP-mannose 4,6-dehydratase [Trueperaceae bacterium]
MRAFITGVTGQDGWYLAEFLLAKGYEVHGLVRWSASPRPVPEGVVPHLGDMLEADSLISGLRSARPDEVYNLAAIADIGASRLTPTLAWRVNCTAALAMMSKTDTRFFQASSAQMDGDNPYSKAKNAAHLSAARRRERGQYVSTGILFNHESPRHSDAYVLPKIARAAARGEHVELRGLGSQRDWGWAPDYVEAMWLTLQQPEPDDYEIGTGILHSVEDICRVAYGPAFRESITAPNGSADATRAADTSKLAALGWTTKTSFDEVVRRVMTAL